MKSEAEKRQHREQKKKWREEKAAKVASAKKAKGQGFVEKATEARANNKFAAELFANLQRK